MCERACVFAVAGLSPHETARLRFFACQERMKILSPVIGRCPSFVSLRLFLINQRHVGLREDNQLALRSVPAVNDVDQGETLAAILSRFGIISVILRRKLTGTGY